MSTTAALALFWIGTWLPAVIRVLAVQNQPPTGWQPSDYIALGGVASSFVLGLIVAFRRRDNERDHHHDEEMVDLIAHLIDELRATPPAAVSPSAAAHSAP